MKKIYSFILISVLLFGACSLEERPFSALPEDDAYATPELVYLNAVVGLYNDMLSFVNYCQFDLSEFTTDEALVPVRGSDWYDGGKHRVLHNHQWTSALEVFQDYWNDRYSTIGKCNQSLSIVEREKANNPSDTFYDAYLAEIRAIRAFNYFYLLETFGRIPVSKSVDVAIDQVKQSNRSDVFTFVKEELQEVLPLLPAGRSNKEGANYGRITQPVAWFLLAKLALNAEVYSDDDWVASGGTPSGSDSFTVDGTDIGSLAAVKHYCDLITQEGYQLEDDFSLNFSVRNETSDENIFVIPQDPDTYRISNTILYNRPFHYTHGDAFGMGTWNGMCATVTTMKALGFGTSNPDPRLELSFYTGKVVGPDGEYIKAEDGSDFEYLPMRVELDMEGSDEEKQAGARWKKYEVDLQFQGRGDYVHNDWVMFRYADVLLMEAEVDLKLGDATSALDLVNRIRDRVGAAPLTALTLDDILNERMLELSNEMWRRNDMIRFGTFLLPFPDKPASEPFRLVYPIPANVLSSNQNLVQNPGY